MVQPTKKLGGLVPGPPLQCGDPEQFEASSSCKGIWWPTMLPSAAVSLGTVKPLIFHFPGVKIKGLENHRF
jgi:hypothetical protein